MKKAGIFWIVLIILILGISPVYAKTTMLTGKVVTNNAVENINYEAPIDMQDLYKQASPAVVKILVYADYSYYSPLVEDVDFSEYNRNIARYGEANFTKDVRVIYDSTQNMYDEWGRQFNDPDYAHDFNEGLGYGSGFLVSPDGYILTNSHVAVINKTYYENFLKASIIYNQMDYINQNYYAGNYQTDYDYAYDLAVYNFMIDNLKVSLSNIEVVAVVGVDSNEKSTFSKTYGARLVDSEGDISKYAEESLDWALLKIDGDNLPYLHLGDSDSVSIGSKVILIGYPGVSEAEITTSTDLSSRSPYISLRKDIEPTLSSGYVSYIRPILNNYKTFQLDASISAGNSGGPALDKNGDVIGIVTYGYSNYLGGNYNYAQRINDIKPNLAGVVNLPQRQASNLTVEANNQQSSQEEPSSLGTIIVIILGLVILLSTIAILIKHYSKKSSNQGQKQNKYFNLKSKTQQKDVGQIFDENLTGLFWGIVLLAAGSLINYLIWEAGWIVYIFMIIPILGFIMILQALWGFLYNLIILPIFSRI